MRRIFLNPRPNIALLTAAELLGVSLAELRADIESGAIVATSTGIGLRVRGRR